jgi:NAD(P)-dependent dehydrogenase (short-subunit alcohol dehydrogenase family)
MARDDDGSERTRHVGEFDGKTVMITGAAGNLGRAVAGAFAGAGANEVLVDLDVAGLGKAFGPDDDRRLAIAADLADRKALDAACEQALKKFGRIDALCNIAGGFHMGEDVHETPDDVWRRMIDLNAGSLLNACGAAVPRMLAGGGGRIVNVAAGAALRGGARMGAYAAAKSAVIRLTESMSAELKDRNINVNCVMPSIIDTPQNRAAMPDADASRWVTPEALAEVLVFLASDRARAIHGAAIPVSGLV